MSGTTDLTQRQRKRRRQRRRSRVESLRLLSVLSDIFSLKYHLRSRKLRLIEKPNIRDVLVFIYGFKLFDEVRCVLLYDLNRWVTLICINVLLKKAVLRCMDGSCCEWSK